MSDPKADPKPDPKTDPAASVSKDDFEKLKADHTALMQKFEALNKKPDPEDPDLKKKSELEREADDKKKSDVKSLESAISYNMNSKKWLDDNASLLPKEINDIFKTADSEKYDSAIQKTSAIKEAVVQSFFAVQSNLDLLTPGQKSVLDDFLKLTKNARQDRASSVYDTIFEPAFEMLKRVTKAEHLQKGHGDGSDDAYKLKLMNGSKKHYLGEKSNAT